MLNIISKVAKILLVLFIGFELLLFPQPLQASATTPNFVFGQDLVLDSNTNLMWTRDAKSPSPSACTPGGLQSYSGNVSCLNSNNFLGYSDWIVPDINQLANMAKYGGLSPYSGLNSLGFINVQPNMYWSSTPIPPGPAGFGIQAIDMTNGNYGAFFNVSGFVWPVRVAKPGDNLNTPVAGSCGSSSGGMFISSPSSNLCGINNSASAVTGSGPWNWNCTGNDRGSTVNCLANIQTYSVSATVNGTPANGTISCATPVIYNNPSVCIITPATGYHLSGFTLGGVDQFAQVINNSYTINGITANQTVTGSFAINSTITGNVTDLITGNPLAAVSVTITGGATTQTDTGGNFTFSSSQIAAGIYTLTFTKSGYSATTVNNVVVTNTAGAMVKIGISSSVPLSDWALDNMIISGNMAFGNQYVGASTSPKEIALYNNGTNPLSIDSLILSGIDLSQFAIALGGSSPCTSLPPTIAVGGKCTLSLTFTPTSKGSKAAKLSVMANSKSLDIPLTGTALTTISGNVTDLTTGNKLAAATVSITGGATTQTDSNGNFNFNPPPANGTYTVTFSKTGYVTLIKNNVIISNTSGATLNVGLTTGPLNISSTSPLPPTVTGLTYNQHINVTGGAVPFVYSITTGSLPTGLSLDAVTGSIYGMPNKAGNYIFSIGVTDGLNAYAEKEFSISVADSLNITTVDLPKTVAFSNYNYNINVTGGTPPYTYAITSGLLPYGLQLGSISGSIAGTLTNKVECITGYGCLGISTGYINIVSGVVSFMAIADITCIYPYVCNLYANDTNTTLNEWYGDMWGIYGYNDYYTNAQAGVHNFTIQFKNISNISQSSINNTNHPTYLGIYLPAKFVEQNPITIKVTDSFGRNVSKNFNLIVYDPITHTTPKINDGMVGVLYSQQLSATGGNNGVYTWSIQSGVLPIGLSIDSVSGVVSGTPTSAITQQVNIAATDSEGLVGYNTYTFNILKPLQVLTTSMPDGFKSNSYYKAIQLDGGKAPYSFSSSGQLPTGLSLNASTGVISGTPTSGGYTNISVTITDSTYPTPQSQTQNLGIRIWNSVPRNLSVTSTGQGSVTSTPQNGGAISCTSAGINCATVFPDSASVVLSAIPTANSVFSNWAGACSGSVSTCNLTMDSDKAVTAAFKVNQTISTISFNPALLNVGGTTTVSATTTSGLGVSFSSTTPNVCSTNGVTVTGLTVGNCTIAANQTGNTNYIAAQQVTQDINVGYGNQSISVSTPAPSNAAYNSQFTVSATTNSGLPVTYSSGNTSSCTVNGATFTMIVPSGTCIVQYDQAGNTNYTAATRVTNIVTATKASQTISNVNFNPTQLTAGSSTIVSATANSGLGVSFSSTTTNICTVNSSTVTGNSVGTCTIAADQIGDSNYDAAPQVTMNIIVGPGSHNLSVSVTGQGTVTSAPQNGKAISCTETGNDCATTFPDSTAVILTATPTAASLFSTWGGVCSGISVTCNLTMDSDKSVTATFSAIFPVLLFGTQNYYHNLLDAYNLCSAGSTVTWLLQQQDYQEGLNINKAIDINLKGGYDSAFSANSGNYSILHGIINVGNGSLTIENIQVY